MMQDQVVLKKALVPMNSMSVSVLGRVAANVQFQFKTEIIVLEDVQQVMESHLSLQKGMNLLISTFLKTTPELTKIGKSISSVGQSTAIRCSDDSLMDALFQIQKTKVYIKGTLALENESNLPITAIVFAESHEISWNGRTIQVVSTNNPIVGHLQGNDCTTSSVASRFHDKPFYIIPLAGGQIGIERIPKV